MSFNLRRALISVSDKTHLLPLAEALQNKGVEIISTGGTASFLQQNGIKVTMVAEITRFPEIMNGRVKTLHPKIHGGLLARRDLPEHQAAMAEHDIQGIDLAVINLYPFAAALAAGADFRTCIENIDVGGPAMIRAAAKNHDFVAILTNPADYAAFIAALEQGIEPDSVQRRMLARKAFAHTAAYDSAIAQWLAEKEGLTFPDPYLLSGKLKQKLRYGENPHQEASLYETAGGYGLPQAVFLQGKELSYNNLADGDAALNIVSEFSEPAAVIVKHANPCGVAIGADIEQAYEKALAADPVSAFGGIVAFNREVGDKLARKLSELFLEVVIALDFSTEALRILSTKKNLRLLKLPMAPNGEQGRLNIKNITGGFLLQESDQSAGEEGKLVTQIEIEAARMPDLLFANRVVKHVSSNAIVVAKSGQTLGIGAGQMSRIDAVEIALKKAGPNAKGAVLASDAFFPFPDSIIKAKEAGISAIIQPGGSQKDADVIATCNEKGIGMVFTGRRHFRH